MVQIFEPVVLVEGEFSPNLHPVEQSGYIDLRVSSASGVVPADLEGTEGSFNGIDDPASILGMPDDQFSAIRSAKAVGSLAESHDSGDAA